jgi:glycosyltransferase involved in cell wall biosynthesis
MAIEHADYATILGNEFTIGTYAYAGKPLFRVPISTPVLYDWPDDRDLARACNRFLWFGSEGFVHKGLDLVLEAFAELPDHELTVCGPIRGDRDFERAYYRELYNTPNIHTMGWVQVTSPEFQALVRNCIGLVFPSCSEGQSGGVVTCLHAGLVPIVSYESGVDVDPWGVVLRDCSAESIRQAVRAVSSLPASELKTRTRLAWDYARANHTKEKFAEAYAAAISAIVAAAGRKERVGAAAVQAG